MTFFTKLKLIKTKLDSKLDLQKRTGYKVDKKITRVAFGLLAFYLFILLVSGMITFETTYYVECPAELGQPCLNPFYDEACIMSGEECKQKLLDSGEIIGDKEAYDKIKNNVWLNTFPILIICTLAFAFNINHMKNKNAKKREASK